MSKHSKPNAELFGSQLGTKTSTPLSYTAQPWRLCYSDIRLFFTWIIYLPNIVLPIGPWPSGYLDELYPSRANLYDIILHGILFIAQATFLLSIPFLIFMPFGLFISYLGGFCGLNYFVCQLLNWSCCIPSEGLQPTEDAHFQSWAPCEDEYWIFLNGVAVGTHWLQSNIDRLSRAFHRPVVGIHNKTNGIIFDIIQCLIQRSLLVATSNVRQCYTLVKNALYKKGIKKVVLILHSQGGIEGSMIVDWLLNEVPQDLMAYLEIYTFGNAANHFNNPYRNNHCSEEADHYTEDGDCNINLNMVQNRVISHIEHYVNSEDFVGRWGVLNFVSEKNTYDDLENRFMGRVFVRPGKGHQLNQHYLDTIFPLDSSGRFTRDPRKGDFMDMVVRIVPDDTESPNREGPELSLKVGREGDHQESFEGHKVSSPPEQVGLLKSRRHVERRVRDYSRLWLYRNGGKPAPMEVKQMSKG